MKRVKITLHLIAIVPRWMAKHKLSESSPVWLSFHDDAKGYPMMDIALMARHWEAKADAEKHLAGLKIPNGYTTRIVEFPDALTRLESD